MSTWDSFARENRALWLAADVPVDMASNQRAFDYLLMHGYHPKWPYFRVDEQLPRARDAMLELVARYVVAFYDPGLAIFSHTDQERLTNLVASLGAED